MKKIIILLTLYLASCQAMNNATPPRSGSLKGYEYAAVIDISVDGLRTSPFISIRLGLYNTLTNTAKFHVIDKTQIDSLSDNQKQKLLLVRYAESSDDAESTVDFYFDDYLTGKQVAYCRGASSNSFSRGENYDRAWYGAINEMIKLR